MAVVWLANATAKPELDEADMDTVFVGLKVWLAGVPKVMVWLALATVKDCVTVEAALYVAFPAWFAEMVQVPAASMLAVVPDTEQMLGVDEENVTARPEVAEADNVNEVPNVRVPGLLKVIV